MSIDTVNDVEPLNSYTAIAAQTVFDYTFPIFADGDLAVYVDGVLQAVTTDYTVTGAGDDAGGTITFLSAMAGGETLAIYRDLPIERTTDFQQNGPNRSASMNDELDRITLVMQQLNRDIKRSIRSPLTSAVNSADLELDASAYANKYLSFDANGKPEPAALVSGTITQSVIGEFLYPRTPAESAALITPSNPAIPSGDAVGLVNVMRYVPAGTVADGVYDFTAAINSAIAVITAVGGQVYLPAGQYKVTAEITLPAGVMLYGAGRIRGMDASREGVTSILGVHTGRSVISLQGAIGASLRDFSIETGAGAIPKCALLLGRSSAASAGIHNIAWISIYGYYSVCPYYSIASEDNTIHDLFIWLFGGGAKYCTYTSISDKLGVGGSLIASSNLDNRFTHACFINSSRDPDAACVYIDADGATGSVTYRDSYFHEFAGAYVQIHSNTSDALGPFTFDNCCGEIYANGNPAWGYRLSCAGTRTLRGLNINGGQRYAFNAGDADGIASLATLVGGAGYTNGTYGTTTSPIALTGGTGTGAQAVITIAGGAVTQVDIVRCGDGYLVNDTLSVLAANVGGTGAGFSIKVNTIGIYQIQQAAGLTLESPNIHMQPPEAFPYALCSVIRSQIKSGNVIVGRFAEWVEPTLAGTWVNSFGAPNAQFSYCMDGFGRVRLRGTIQGGTGTIFTLPADYRPASNQRFTILIVAGTVAEILVTASTGVVSMTSGAGTAMNMGQIEFDTAA